MSKAKEPTEPLPLLSPANNSDSSFDISLSMEYNEQGWLDCNPEAKMYLSNLDKEEYISDDETEVMSSLPGCLTCTDLFNLNWTYVHTVYFIL